MYPHKTRGVNEMWEGQVIRHTKYNTYKKINKMAQRFDWNLPQHNREILTDHGMYWKWTHKTN